MIKRYAVNCWRKVAEKELSRPLRDLYFVRTDRITLRICWSAENCTVAQILRRRNCCVPRFRKRQKFGTFFASFVPLQCSTAFGPDTHHQQAPSCGARCQAWISLGLQHIQYALQQIRSKSTSQISTGRRLTTRTFSTLTPSPAEPVFTCAPKGTSCPVRFPCIPTMQQIKALSPMRSNTAPHIPVRCHLYISHTLWSNAHPLSHGRAFRQSAHPALIPNLLPYVRSVSRRRPVVRQGRPKTILSERAAVWVHMPGPMCPLQEKFRQTQIVFTSASKGHTTTGHPSYSIHATSDVKKNKWSTSRVLKYFPFARRLPKKCKIIVFRIFVWFFEFPDTLSTLDAILQPLEP